MEKSPLCPPSSVDWEHSQCLSPSPIKKTQNPKENKKNKGGGEGTINPSPRQSLALCHGNWQLLPLKFPSYSHLDFNFFYSVSSSTCCHLLSYSRNVLKSFIYNRPSFPISSLLQIYFFLHSNTVISVEFLARRVLNSHAQSTILHQTLPHPMVVFLK